MSADRGRLPAWQDGGARLHSPAWSRGRLSRIREADTERIDLLLDTLEVLPLEPPADRCYAETRNHLTRAGAPIGPNDLLIAAHALAADLRLVTANTRKFERVPSLHVENWLLA